MKRQSQDQRQGAQDQEPQELTGFRIGRTSVEGPGQDTSQLQ